STRSAPHFVISRLLPTSARLSSALLKATRSRSSSSRHYKPTQMKGDEYNYRKSGASSRKDAVAESEAAPDSGAAKLAAGVGVDWANFIREAPGMSAFALEDGVVYHLLGLRARLGRVVGCLPVARPRAQ